nr:plasma membrane proteolipid 3 [Quercus suber]
MPFTGSDIIKIIFAIFVPPIGVFLERGCGADLLINILLTILGYIPGIIHALWRGSDGKHPGVPEFFDSTRYPQILTKIRFLSVSPSTRDRANRREVWKCVMLRNGFSAHKYICFPSPTYSQSNLIPHLCRLIIPHPDGNYQTLYPVHRSTYEVGYRSHRQIPSPRRFPYQLQPQHPAAEPLHHPFSLRRLLLDIRLGTPLQRLAHIMLPRPPLLLRRVARQPGDRPAHRALYAARHPSAQIVQLARRLLLLARRVLPLAILLQALEPERAADGLFAGAQRLVPRPGLAVGIVGRDPGCRHAVPADVAAGVRDGVARVRRGFLLFRLGLSLTASKMLDIDRRAG